MEGIVEMFQGYSNNKVEGMYEEMNDHLPGRLHRVKAANAKAATDMSPVFISCQAHNLDPIERLVRVLDTGMSPGEEARTLLGLMEYMYPKLMRTEVTGRDGGPIALGIVRLPDKAPIEV